MTELHAILRAEIERLGSIPFDRFMDAALYHPEHGYYRRKREQARTGRAGDFFTSVSVGPLFGRLLARQFCQMWEELGKPNPFWIVEQGAEDGQLAADVLSWCRAQTPSFFAAIRYAVIEKDASLQNRQRETLRAGGLDEKIAWFAVPEALSKNSLTGVFFSNELVDAFSVRRVRYRNGAWCELHVAVGRENPFEWTEKSLEDEKLQEAVLSLPVAEGYTTEIRLIAGDWMREVGGAMKSGYVLTIDYGFPASIYYAPFRRDGTLTAYLEHQRLDDMLTDPGSRDITAHVDFTALARAGQAAGLDTLGFVDQQHFLMGIAHDELSGTTGPACGIAENLRAWQTLIHPDYLGTRFQVLLQAKNAPANLAGLRYARPGGLD